MLLGEKSRNLQVFLARLNDGVGMFVERLGPSKCGMLEWLKGEPCLCTGATE